LRPLHSYGSVLKMRKKIVVSMIVVAMLLIGVMATSVLASNVTLARNANASKELTATAKSVTAESLGPVREVSRDSAISKQAEELPELDVAEELEATADETLELGYLKEMVPKTYEEADALICVRTRFLLYTHDGRHIMWGFVGNGYFVGQDNLGKRCWGIYGNNVFAGFYDGDFFWGKYRCGNWKAEGLFGENYTSGKYILFPTTNIAPAITAADP
jgi:hypothetical protein